MIIVTGTPNSGTSLMMQYLKHCDLHVQGHKFPFENKKHSNERIQELYDQKKQKGYEKNPHGFYEGDWSMKGLKEKLNGVFKLQSVGLINTNPQLWDKCIVCVRNPFKSKKPALYCQRMQRIFNYLQEHRHKLIVIDYDDWFVNTEETGHKVCTFLGVQYKNPNYIIDKKLNRTQVQHNDTQAQAIYDAVRGLKQ